MLLEEITHKSTLKAVQNYGIDVSPFSDKEELRMYIKLNQGKLYSQKNREYFRNYMRDRYRALKGGKVNKYERKVPPEAALVEAVEAAEPATPAAQVV
jgi:hypothetical protein